MEIGYAIGVGKQVFCYSSDGRELKHRITEDFPHLLNDGMAIEDFGRLDNLMITLETSMSLCLHYEDY